MQETLVWSLGWEDPLEKDMANRSSILAKSPVDRGAWWATAHGVTESDRAERLTRSLSYLFISFSSWLPAWELSGETLSSCPPDGFSLLHVAFCVLYPNAHGSGQFGYGVSPALRCLTPVAPGGSKKRRLRKLLLAAQVGPSVQDSLWST